MEILDKPVSQIAAYAPFYADLSRLEAENALIVFDYESKKGNKEARSHVFALRKSNAELERTRKAAKEDSIKVGKAIDAEAREIAERISAMIEVHQVKLDEIEKRETGRVDAIRAKIAEFSVIQKFLSIPALENHIAGLVKTQIDLSYGEFSVDAASALYASTTAHRELLAEKIKAEAEAAELAELRKLAADQKIKDAEAAAIKEATELAERQRVDAEVKALSMAAEIELRAKQREADLLATAEAEKIAAAKREFALREEAESEKAAAIKAEQDKFAAMVAETKRVEAAEAAERARREADTKHKGAINRGILEVLLTLDMPEATAKHLIKLIACGKIQHVSINY